MELVDRLLEEPATTTFATFNGTFACAHGVILPAGTYPTIIPGMADAYSRNTPTPRDPACAGTNGVA